MRTLMVLTALALCAPALLAAQSTPTPTEPPAKILTGHSGGVTDLAWSPDGAILASSSGDYTADDHTVRLWSADGQPSATLDNGALTYSLSWSPDGKTLAAGGQDGVIHLYQPDGGLSQTFGASGLIVFSLSWSPDGTLLAAGESGGPSVNQVEVWNADGTPVRTLRTNYSGGKFYNVGWSPDGRYLAAGAVDYSLWRADGTLIVNTGACASCTPSWGFGWSADSTMWAIGNESGGVAVFGVDGHVVTLLQNDGNVDALQWSPTAMKLAGGNSIWTWDGSQFTTTGGGFNARTALVWSPDGTRIAAANVSSEAVRIADASGKTLARLDQAAVSLAWSPDGKLLAIGSPDGEIRLTEVMSDEE